MDLEDPIAAYNAESNLEAIQIAEYLVSQGIDAHASRDESVVGLWMFGRLPEIHKPQVWVSRRDSDAVATLLTDYEVERRRANPRPKPQPSGDDLDVTCEDCGMTSTFSAALNGTIQRCPSCWGHVDVGEYDWPDVDFGEEDDAA